MAQNDLTIQSFSRLDWDLKDAEYSSDTAGTVGWYCLITFAAIAVFSTAVPFCACFVDSVCVLQHSQCPFHGIWIPRYLETVCSLLHQTLLVLPAAQRLIVVEGAR